MTGRVTEQLNSTTYQLSAHGVRRVNPSHRLSTGAQSSVRDVGYAATLENAVLWTVGKNEFWAQHMAFRPVE